MTRAIAELGATRYRTTIDAEGHALVSDEPVSRGGGDAGPTPYALLAASLAACTAITLRMYADRKQWELPVLTVEVRHGFRDGGDRLERTLHFPTVLSDEQRARLLEIADRTPVTRTLMAAVTITTTMD